MAKMSEVKIRLIDERRTPSIVVTIWGSDCLGGIEARREVPAVAAAGDMRQLVEETAAVVAEQFVAQVTGYMELISEVEWRTDKPARMRSKPKEAEAIQDEKQRRRD